MTFAPDAQHLVPNAGDPQTEPGPECGHPSKPAPYAGRYDAWGTRKRWWNDWCDGCKAIHPVHVGLAAFGLRRILPHKPSPPPTIDCWICHQPLESYTPTAHAWCDTAGADDVWAEGHEPATPDW